LAKKFHAEIFAPADAVRMSSLTKIKQTPPGLLTGHFWEQIELPIRARTYFLLNFCNLGPVASRNAATMMHDAQVYQAPDSYSLAFRAYYKMVQPIIGRRHHFVLTVSAFSREQLARERVATPDQIEVIHNGVDHVSLDQSSAHILERLNLSPGKYVIGVASTQPHKNIQILFDAFADERLAHIPLVLFGAADEQAFLESGMTPPKNVVFAGRLDNEEICGLMANALCIGFPSRTEGFGLPPLEAMRLGCPAVVASCGALPEVCGTAAAYADPDNAGAWVRAIYRIAENSDFRNQLVVGGEKQARKFVWENAAIKLFDILERRQVTSGPSPAMRGG
jgi:glycosyltransferase involved in cell wall biosynthesis